MKIEFTRSFLPVVHSHQLPIPVGVVFGFCDRT